MLSENFTYDHSLTYLSSPDGIFAVAESTTSGFRLHYIHTDNLGSWDIITDMGGSLEQSLSFDAWGNRRNASTWNGPAHDEPLFDRGFTGHEHLYNFGLINMNGRVYDPYMSTFLSPDNYIQAPDNSQNFNRYAYCLNNPLKYTDPDGEFWHIIAGALIGGVANLAANWDNCEGPWEYITAFGVGAGAGALTAATGGAGASVWAVAGVSALGSAATAATNSVIAQTQNNFTEGTVNWDQVGNSAVYGAIAGFASGAAGYAVGTGLNVRLYDANIKSPLLQSMIVSPLAAGAGHIAAGTAIGVYNGKSFDQAVFDSFDGIGQSMAIGGAIGVASTIGVCYSSGVNPWNGKTISLQTGKYTVYRGIDPTTGEVKYVGITKRDPNVRWNEHYNSNSERATLIYEKIEDGLTKTQARIMEQNLINKYGIQKNGGQLYNRINSISSKFWDKYKIKY